VIEGASVRCYPRDDRQFAADVNAALSAGSPDEPAVIDELKSKYPHVRIVRRDSLAGMKGQADVVYAYREGRLIVA
jgi:hypothetical protein